MLQGAREAAAASSLSTSSLVSLGPRKTALFSFAGDRVQQTLAAMWAATGCRVENEGIAVVVPAGIEETASLIKSTNWASIPPLKIAKCVGTKQRRKYDWLFDDELLSVSLVEDLLCIPEAIRVLNTAQEPIR
jgi:hypothetical protein